MCDLILILEMGVLSVVTVEFNTNQSNIVECLIHTSKNLDSTGEDSNVGVPIHVVLYIHVWWV